MPYILYQAKCLVNGKRYIGRTIHTLEHRRKQHERIVYSDKLPRTKFQRALVKYGLDNFQWRILKEYLTLEKLIAAEIRCIAHFDTVTKGYNITSGGEGFCASHTKKAKAKMSKSQIERFSNDSEHVAISKAVKRWREANPKRVEAQQIRMREAMATEKVRDSISNGVKDWYANNPEIAYQMRKRIKKAFRRNNSAEKISRSLGGRPIKVYKDGKLFDTFNTQAACCRTLGLGKGNVNSCLRGRRKETGGFTFKYAKLAT